MEDSEIKVGDMVVVPPNEVSRWMLTGEVVLVAGPYCKVWVSDEWNGGYPWVGKISQVRKAAETTIRVRTDIRAARQPEEYFPKEEKRHATGTRD